MNGIELSAQYYSKYGKEMLLGKYSDYFDKMAVGLVGEGSQCFGYDDLISRDHDFGPDFCIWMPEDTFKKIGKQLEYDYFKLLKEAKEFSYSTPEAKGRTGPNSIENFYKKYIGLNREPINNIEWFRIPETFLATATNGVVFEDSLGTFTNIRNTLRKFYPTDVWKKKLAARLAIIAQSGQYNFPRSLKRGDLYAAYFACVEFVKATLAVVFILNKRYMPYYKWTVRAAEELELLADVIVGVKKLMLLNGDFENNKERQNLIEEICNLIIAQLKDQNLTFSKNEFLEIHGKELMKSIEDPQLRGLHIMVDFDK